MDNVGEITDNNTSLKEKEDINLELCEISVKGNMEPIRFRPPLYQQRYDFVKSYVDIYKPKKVADLGCSECSLLQRLKFWDCIEQLVGVDIDEDTLKSKMYMLTPLPTHYLEPMNRSLTVTLYHGSVSEKDPALLGFDLITCIELIEHLEADDLEKLQDVLFGFMAPNAAVISTPNVEFNVLLPENPKFRHPDHKFEWSRKEFQCWAEKVAGKYNYTVEFSGVGKPPAGHEDVGFCSQIGIFNKNYIESEESISKKSKYPSVYKTVLHVVYPSLQEEKYLRRTVLNVALSHAYHIKSNFLHHLFAEEDDDKKSNMTDYENKSCIQTQWFSSLQTAQMNAESTCLQPFLKGDTIQVPLARLFAISRVKELCGSLDVLRNMLSGEVTLSSDGSTIVYPVNLENDDMVCTE